MKHFIYMDTDILNSYISQFNDGLITKTYSEVIDQTLTSKTDNSTEPMANTNFKLSIPALLNIGLDNKDEMSSTTTALTQSQSGRELIDKMFHDNAFNHFIKYLKDKQELKNDKYSIGDYVSITSTHEFWDMDYLLKIFNENLVGFMVGNDSNLYKETFLMNKGKEANVNDVKKYEKLQKEQYEQIRNLIQMCKDIMPFTKFMMINDCFVPLNDEFLRESVNSIRFKYTGKITLIGKYTNDYKGIIEQDEGNAFSQLFSSIDGVINMFLKESLNIPNFAKVITPIALYFE